MAKALIKVESDFKDLVADFESLVADFPELTKEAANAQMEVIEHAIKTNWTSMVPWANAGDYVYDSIGYNTEYGDNSIDVVGSVGVFHIDSVRASHGYDQPIVLANGLGKKRPNAPQLAYWVEFGYIDWNKRHVPGVPFMGNAFYGTVSQQDNAFANTFFKRMNRTV